MVEIERKFLVDHNLWKQVDKGEGKLIAQGYIQKSPEKTVRVRIKKDKGYLTIKGKTEGISRAEFEYEIPLVEAKELLKNFCGKIIEKTRYEVKIGLHTWEVDEFHSPNPELILAEIELNSEEEVFEKPEWIGKEVSDDVRYFNANMI